MLDKATLRLFSAIQIDGDAKKTPSKGLAHSKETVKRLAEQGLCLDPNIKVTEARLKLITQIMGLSGEKANSTFHKSWDVIRDAPMKQLVLQQIVHYMTTYGFESMGIYHEDAVYIPHEVLEVPALEKGLPLAVVKGMTSEQLLDATLELGSGIALSEASLEDIMAIVSANQFDPAFVRKIENRELKARLFKHYDLVPDEPVDFLRYVITQLTGESLIIKNKALIEAIKQSDRKVLDALINKAPDDLASIFLRYKPLFLAMKSVSTNKTFFNRLRKDADEMHKRIPQDYMNSVTNQIKLGTLDLDVLKRRLEKASIFRKIRLAYALNYRLHATNSTVYRVRSGRGWATDFDWPEDLKDVTADALILAIDSIAEDMRPRLKDMLIYIPSQVHYALPATEKQFTGNLPTGTYVTMPENTILGIHWMDVCHHRIDLDLSLITAYGKYGWDGSYRSDERSILFSGDMTAAPKPLGATELFHIRKGTQPSILFANYYNFNPKVEVETKLLVAQEKPKKFKVNYMVDPNNILLSANLVINKRQNVLGFLTSVNGENRFCFANVSVGNSITSSTNEQATHARQYLFSQFENPLDFRDILSRAGAIVTSEKPEEDHIDLAPESLDKTSFLKLIQA